MERLAVYAGTRNLYHDMTVCAKSLLCHDGADRILFLIEDDTFPEPLPECINTMNVSGQTFFRPTGPNYTCRWTYMVMMRVALPYLLPDHDRVLALDCDTLVMKDVDLLWNIDIADHYFALVEEKQIRCRRHPYYNFGVAVHNLAKLRDGTADTIIRTVNSVYLQYCEQDAVNDICARHILELPPEYNAIWFNKPQVPDEDAHIIHYAAMQAPFSTKPGYAEYDALSWNEVMNMKEVNRNG